MNDALRKFIEELQEKELSGADRFFSRVAPTKFPNGDTLIPIEARKQYPIYDVDRFVESYGLDYFKEMVVKDMMKDLLHSIDEMGAIALDAHIAGLDKIEFKLTLKVMKDGREESFASRGYNPDQLRDWPLRDSADMRSVYESKLSRLVEHEGKSTEI